MLCPVPASATAILHNTVTASSEEAKPLEFRPVGKAIDNNDGSYREPIIYEYRYAHLKSRLEVCDGLIRRNVLQLQTKKTRLKLLKT